MDNIDVQEMKKQIQQEVAAANFQELVSEMTDKCFNYCIKKPGTTLDSYEQKCMSNCMDRFIDSYNVVSKVFAGRLSSGNELG